METISIVNSEVLTDFMDNFNSIGREKSTLNKNYSRYASKYLININTYIKSV